MKSNFASIFTNSQQMRMSYSQYLNITLSYSWFLLTKRKNIQFFNIFIDFLGNTRAVGALRSGPLTYGPLIPAHSRAQDQKKLYF